MKIKAFFVVLFVGAFSTIAQTVKKDISGRIAKEEGPLKNVNVRVKNTSTGVLTNAKGKYEIKAFIGDTLIFSYVGFHTVQVPIDNENTIYDLDMYTEVQKLDEVVVKEKKAFTQKELLAEYPTNMNLIKTSQGILDKDRASFSIRIIDGKNIINVGTDILYSLVNLHPQMEVIRDCLAETICPQVILQKWSSGANPAAIFDVDGFIYEQAPTFLAAQDVDRVAILTRNGAISRYGSAGTGGVIIINTKSKTWMDDIAIKRTFENHELRDSISKKIGQPVAYNPNTPNYINELNNADLKHTAEILLEKQKIQFGSSPYYFFDVAKYFKNRWNDNKKSEALLNIIANTFSNDVAVLKALAYRYEELDQKEKSLEVYLKILKIKSKEAQSHRDVANAYYEIGNYKKALGNYARYELAVNELDTLPFDTYGVDLLMTTETRNIVRVRGKELFLDKKWLQEHDTWVQNVRLLFEWNHPNADFKLRLVSPDDYYDDWRNPALKSLERSKGYYSKEFFLDNDFKGEWQININYFGNNADVPTYLKVTAYFDYGKSSQSKEFKVFKLQERDKDIKLISVFAKEKHITP